MSRAEVARGLRGVVGVLVAVAVCPLAAPEAGARAWTPQALARPGGSLDAVSCPSASLCVAVGVVRHGSDGTVTLAELWSAGRSRVLPTRNGPGSGDTELTGVSCASTTACTAVGLARYDGRTEPLAERWDGLRWSIQRTPHATAGFLTAVSCSSASACMAVGGTGSFPGGERSALAERWSRSGWSIQRLPTAPSKASSETLTGVSCPTQAVCEAVGNAYAKDSSGAVVAMRWNGAAWAAQLPRGGGFGEDFVDAVSCASPQACMAVGGGGDGSSSWGTWTRWNGAKWSGVRESSTPNVVLGVSCPLTIACTSVGGPLGLAFGGYAGRWNGSRWSVETVSASLHAELDADSCASVGRCVAVGYLTRTGKPRLPLVAVRS